MENNENRGIVIEDDSLENALTRASKLLHIDRARVSYRVIESGSNGILGLFGKKKLVIRAWADEFLTDTIPKTPLSSQPEPSGEGDTSRERDDRSTFKKREASQERGGRHRREKSREKDAHRNHQRDDRPRKREADTSPKRREADTPPQKRETENAPQTRKVDDPSLQNDSHVQDAREFLSGLLTRMGADPTITTQRVDDGILLNITSDTEGMLIGRKGQTLDALQYILNRYLARPSGYDGKIILDVEDYRDRREARIKKMAQDIARKVKKSGKPVAAQPMGSGERRIFHLTLKNDSDITTESRGRGEKRKVIVYPKKSDKRNS